MGNPRSKSVKEKFYINAAGEQLVLLNRSIIILVHAVWQWLLQIIAV